MGLGSADGGDVDATTVGVSFSAERVAAGSVDVLRFWSKKGMVTVPIARTVTTAAVVFVIIND
jgi:hypothetical protein